MAVRRTAGWGPLQGFINDGENAFQIPVNLIVPEAQHVEALSYEMPISPTIAFCMSIKIVLAAIHFDDQPVLQAYEIHDEIVTWCLTAEMITALSP